MIHVDFLDRGQTTATVPTVCMHCDKPTCAEVCPADAIVCPPGHESRSPSHALTPRRRSRFSLCEAHSRDAPGRSRRARDHGVSQAGRVAGHNCG